MPTTNTTAKRGRPPIYIIISGAYSDWCIQGYATDEETARQICIQHNLEYGDDWYHESVDYIQEPHNRVPLNYVHEIVFDRRDKDWSMRDEPDRYKYYEDGNREIPKHATIDIWPSNKNIIYAKIPQKDFNRKKAEKIAQDMLYQFLYMTDGGENNVR